VRDKGAQRPWPALAGPSSFSLPGSTLVRHPRSDLNYTGTASGMPNARLTRSRRSAIFLAFDSSLHAVWPKRGFRELIFQFFSSQKPAFPQGRLSKVPYIAGYVYFRLQVSRAQLGRAGWLFGACVSDLERSPTSWCRSRLAVGSSRRRPAFCRPRGRRRTPRPASRQPEAVGSTAHRDGCGTPRPAGCTDMNRRTNARQSGLSPRPGTCRRGP
jgi:hypothetical protein